MLFHILDQRAYGYSDDKIAAIWKLASIPPSKIIYKHLNLCSICSQLGHLANNCRTSPSPAPPISSVEAHTPTDNLEVVYGPYRKADTSGPLACPTCASPSHPFYDCLTRLICSACHLLGHTGSQCSRTNILRMAWKPKHMKQGNMIGNQRKSNKGFHLPLSEQSGREGNHANYCWLPKDRKKLQYTGINNKLSQSSLPNAARNQIWRVKTNQLNIRVLPFKNLLAFFRAHIYKSTPPLLMHGEAQEMDMFTVCKNLQYSFVARLLKTFYMPIVHTPVIKVDKRSWDVAFAPLMISYQENEGQPSKASECSEKMVIEEESLAGHTTIPDVVCIEKKKRKR